MKKIHLNQGMLGALLLVAVAVNAEEYPASDFQPKVIYMDESVELAASTTPPPCVSQGVVSQQEVEELDPRYPASSFQPKVIYSENN